MVIKNTNLYLILNEYEVNALWIYNFFIFLQLRTTFWHFQLNTGVLGFCVWDIFRLRVPFSVSLYIFSSLWIFFLERPLPAPVSNLAWTAGGATDPKRCLQPQLLRSLGWTNTALPHARCHFSPWLASFNIMIFSWCLPTDDEALIAMHVPDES